MSLVGGSALQIEDLNVTMKVVTFWEPGMERIYKKYHGKVSKRRFKKILKMARKHATLFRWKDFYESN